MSIQMANVVAGLCCQTQEIVTKAHNGALCLVGKVLIVDSQSAVVAYLKVPLLSDIFGILKGLALIMTTDAYASLQACIPGDWVGMQWWKLGKTVYSVPHEESRKMFFCTFCFISPKPNVLWTCTMHHDPLSSLIPQSFMASCHVMVTWHKKPVYTTV